MTMLRSAAAVASARIKSRSVYSCAADWVIRKLPRKGSLRSMQMEAMPVSAPMRNVKMTRSCTMSRNCSALS